MIDANRWALVGAERMRALDRYTIDELGVPGELLMESAGRAVVDALLAECADVLAVAGTEVLVLCGGGNNGGDGLVVARHLELLKWPVRVALLGSAARMTGDAAANLARARAAGVRIEEGQAADFDGSGVLVDAIFGTGLARDVEGDLARVIEGINTEGRARYRVVSVDLPSGLDADTGQVQGIAVQADLTVTIACPKLGLALEPGRSLAGAVRVARIGIVDALPGELRAEGLEAAQLWTRAAAGDALPARPTIGHKGHFGHVLVLAGSEGKTGAAALAARAAGRSGAGLVTLGCPRGLNDVLEVSCTEAMTVPLPDTKERAFAEDALDAAVALAAERDVVAVGPGIGRAAETVAFMRGLAAKSALPMVIDADGLNAFENDAAALRARPAATVLTPHPGEAARLLQSGASEINCDRVGAARELAAASGTVVLLKGAASVIAAPDGRVIVNPTGGPALASGGTGDVLTGVVAALLAQGLSPFEAAAAAAYLHGAAADRVAEAMGSAGLLAGDVADALPATMRHLREEARHAPADRAFARGTLLAFPDA
jgi:NAD(P)H-hydrate epimerase